MQLNRGAVGGGHGCGAPDWTQLRCRERELVAQLHELLFPSTAPPPSGASVGGASSADLSVEHCGSPVTPPASGVGGKRRGRGRKRVREDERRLQEEETQRGGRSTATKATRGSRRKKEGTTTTTIVTTVPDFDGYQWKKYGQKHIEAAQHPRSYYRCTNSADQACPAKRTVQRNDGGNGDDGASLKYTVVYISEHSCKSTETAAAPVILETTVRTKAQDVASVFPSSSSAVRIGTPSPASSDITWSGGTVAGGNPTPSERGEYCSSLFAVDGDCWEWDPSPMAPAAATALLQEMDFAGPIMSPVHVAATDGSWISDLFVHESPFILNSCELFGF